MHREIGSPIRPNRRQFVALAGNALTGMAAAECLPHCAIAAPAARDWPLGCFNRPWGPWSYDTALDGMRDAGFVRTGLLGDHKDEPFILPHAGQAYLDRLRDRIASRGLTASVAWLRTDPAQEWEDARQAARKQIDHAYFLEARYLLTVGVDDANKYDLYEKVMADAAAYAADRDMLVVLKPHGGCSASADEMLRCVEHVNHPSFRIWYDAGNIVHYTDHDPVHDVARVAHLVVGFSAKDCAAKGGDVMLQFGTGRVDFAEVFRALQNAGFEGPVFMECCAGQTVDEVTANARANHDYLKGVLSSL